MIFLNAAIAGVAIGISLALLGVLIVIKRMSFIGAGLSHTAFAGVAIGYITNMNPILSALIYNGLASYVIAKIKENSDAIIGVLFAVSMALGIALAYVGNITAPLLSILFGDVLSISSMDMYIALAISLITLGVFWKLRKELIYFSFDEDFMKLRGYDVELLRLILLLLTGFMITAAIKLVGILLVSALLVIPPTSALFISKTMREMFAYSLLFSLLSVVGGIGISIAFDLPAGAMIVFVLALIFGICYGVRK